MSCSSPSRLACAAGFLLASLLQGCRDGVNLASTAPAPRLQKTAQLVVAPAVGDDSTITVTVKIAGTGAVRVASLTAAVAYDTTRLRFIADVSPADGALRAMHASRGRVMVAAAEADGFSGEQFAQLKFVLRGPVAAQTLSLQTLSLQVSELHLLDATDARSGLTVLPLAVMR